LTQILKIANLVEKDCGVVVFWKKGLDIINNSKAQYREKARRRKYNYIAKFEATLVSWRVGRLLRYVEKMLYNCRKEVGIQ